MKKYRILLAIGLMACGIGSAFAATHHLTYTKRVGTLGAPFEVNGFTYKLIRVPFKAFEGGKFTITYPINVWYDSDLASGGEFTTTHAEKPLVSNATISGYPARVSIQDLRRYHVENESGTDAAFKVRGDLTATVTIQVGSTLVSMTFSQHHMGTIAAQEPEYWDETARDVGDDVNLTPYAEWPKWRDLKQEVEGFDELIDYIQVTAL